MKDWKSTAAGVLAFLIATFTVVTAFLAPYLLTAPSSGQAMIAKIAAGVTLATALARAWVGLITQNADAAAVEVADSYSTDTNWHIVATDGTGYATLAALKAAGKKPFGCAGLDPGLFFQVVNVTTDNGSAGTSSGGYIAFNRATAPASPPQGEGFMSPGLNRTYPGRFWNVWVQKLATTDRWFFEAKF